MFFSNTFFLHALCEGIHAFQSLSWKDTSLICRAQLAPVDKPVNKKSYLQWEISFKRDFSDGSWRFSQKIVSKYIYLFIFVILSCRRKPLLILTDVLKTDMGKAHMERIKKSLRKQLSGPQKASRPNREQPATCREKSSQRETRNNGSSSLKSNQKTTPSSSQRWQNYHYFNWFILF